ncbi:MAG: 2Fe-2S iron-sulfur cluster binding domain-containing protein [Synergistaceae bacterium]|jgi:succinate dehydrogenase/fumarate reductase-like Fe-S protein|nr:2Fe-2S iron-sulfur cluster binding domain-containing protein [Synergistaceae bacterium]
MKISVRRFPGDYTQDYEIEDAEGESVLNLLERIREKDPSLAFYRSCGIGKCGACRMNINGRERLACAVPATGSLLLEHASGGKVVRDLVTIEQREEGTGGIG